MSKIPMSISGAARNELKALLSPLADARTRYKEVYRIVAASSLRNDDGTPITEAVVDSLYGQIRKEKKLCTYGEHAAAKPVKEPKPQIGSVPSELRQKRYAPRDSMYPEDREQMKLVLRHTLFKFKGNFTKGDAMEHAVTLAAKNGLTYRSGVKVNGKYLHNLRRDLMNAGQWTPLEFLPPYTPKCGEKKQLALDILQEEVNVRPPTNLKDAFAAILEKKPEVAAVEKVVPVSIATTSKDPKVLAKEVILGSGIPVTLKMLLLDTVYAYQGE